VEVADAGKWVGLCVRGLAALGEVGGAEEGRAGEVLDIGAVEQPVVASEDGLMGAGVKVRGEEGLDGWVELGSGGGRPIRVVFRVLEVRRRWANGIRSSLVLRFWWGWRCWIFGEGLGGRGAG